MDKIVTDQRKLRQVSDYVTEEQIKELNLKTRLKEAVKKSWTPGIGLAAIQIGIPLRFGWYRINGKDKYLINPMILEYKGAMVKKREGCLSIPDNFVSVKRAERLVYMNNGVKMSAKGDEAHVIQHEIDHFLGILNVSLYLTCIKAL